MNAKTLSLGAALLLCLAAGDARAEDVPPPAETTQPAPETPADPAATPAEPGTQQRLRDGSGAGAQAQAGQRLGPQDGSGAATAGERAGAQDGSGAGARMGSREATRGGSADCDGTMTRDRDRVRDGSGAGGQRGRMGGGRR